MAGVGDSTGSTVPEATAGLGAGAGASADAGDTTGAGSGAGADAGAGAGAGAGEGEHSGRTPWLVISDVDQTVLGDDGAVVRLKAFAEAHRRDVTFVYSSGRLVDNVLGCIHAHDMPHAAWIIGGVGTEITRCEPGAAARRRPLALAAG